MSNTHTMGKYSGDECPGQFAKARKGPFGTVGDAVLQMQRGWRAREVEVEVDGGSRGSHLPARVAADVPLAHGLVIATAVQLVERVPPHRAHDLLVYAAPSWVRNLQPHGSRASPEVLSSPSLAPTRLRRARGKPARVGNAESPRRQARGAAPFACSPGAAGAFQSLTFERARCL